jgi:hypothetical protein
LAGTAVASFACVLQRQEECRHKAGQKLGTACALAHCLGAGLGLCLGQPVRWSGLRLASPLLALAQIIISYFFKKKYIYSKKIK